MACINKYTCGNSALEIYDDYMATGVLEIKEILLDFYSAVWNIYGEYENCFYSLDEISSLGEKGYVLIK